MASFERIRNALNARIGMSFERTLLYRLTATEIPSIRGMDCDFGWEFLSLETVSRLSEFRDVDMEECRQRLQRGDVCYTVSVDGRTAHFSWVQSSGVHWLREAGFSVKILDGHFWIYHGVTAPWARGRRMYPATLMRIVRDFATRESSAAWIYTTKANLASQKGIARAGFSHVANLPAIRFGEHYVRLRSSADIPISNPGSGGPRHI